jgi:hypothetical protein
MKGDVMKSGIFLCAGLLLALSACASDTESLARATAMSIGRNTAPEQVNVFEVHRGVTSVRWQATTPHGHYSCSADDMVRRPYCVKQ